MDVIEQLSKKSIEEKNVLSETWITVLGQIKKIPIRTDNRSADKNCETFTCEDPPLRKSTKVLSATTVGTTANPMSIQGRPLNVLIS